MEFSSISEIAYLINDAVKNNQNKPIVFLGAGASVTGNVPTANDIVKDILSNFSDAPKIQKLEPAERTYANLMGCLMPYQRNELLKRYIDKAKINVTHIYLAQLLQMGYIDYVLTVNFDNLMLRALSLFNIFPSTYDMAILKDMTTTTFNEKSIIYLHGQHHGLWLLNTLEEMKKVKKVVPMIFNKISDKRAWIFIGYSGEDPIFEHIVNLGRFDNGLYWVTYKDNMPSKKVCENLLDKENTNTFIIKDYDSDLFMQRLCNELKLDQPNIVNKPFTLISEYLDNIVDINGDEYKDVKERLEINKNQVKKAISLFEDGNIEDINEAIETIQVDLLKKQLINIMINENYNTKELISIEKKVLINKDKAVCDLLSKIYISWGSSIYQSAKMNNDECLYKKCIAKFRRAVNINPTSYLAYYNLGTGISALAKLKNDEKLYQKSFLQFNESIKYQPRYSKAYYNWALSLSELAELKKDKELYEESCTKFQYANSLNMNSFSLYSNWGLTIAELSLLNNNENLYREALEKLHKAFDIEGFCYNLACVYARKKNTEDALKHLEICLSKQTISTNYVLNDVDWTEFKTQEKFLEIIEKYK